MAPLLPPDSESNDLASKKFFPRLLKGAGITLGGAAIAGTAGAGWWGWNFIQSDLAPLVQKDLQRRIDRPLEIGDLESVSWGKVTFGKSSLPTYSKRINGTLINDPDRAAVESVEVNFNPWDVILDRTLNLDVTLHKPDVYIDESPDSQWLDFKLISPPGGETLVKTNVRKIRLKDGTVKLSPKRTEDRLLRNFNGEVDITPNQPWINVRGSTEVDSGGKIDLKGRFQTETQNLKLETKSKDLITPPLVGLLPTDLPFQVNQGILNGEVDIEFQPNTPLVISSNIIAKNLEAYIPTQDIEIEAEQFRGKVQLFVQPGIPVELKGGGEIKNARGNLPEDLLLSTGRDKRLQASNVNGNLKFLGTKQRFWSDVSGTIPGGGKVALKGVTSFVEEKAKLNIRGQNIPATVFDQAFEIPLAINKGRVEGNVDIQLSKDERPSVNGTALLKQVDAQIIGLPQPFLNANGVLRLRGLTAIFDDTTANYGEIPILGSGSIDPDRGYNLRGQSKIVEVNRGLKTLGVEALPVPIAGEVVAENVTVTGKIDDPILQGELRTVDTFQFDQLPLKQVAANFRLQNPTLDISNIEARPTTGGILRGQGRYNLTPNVPWTASLAGEGLSGNGIVAFYDADPGFNLGTVSTQINLAALEDDYKLQVDVQAPNGEFPAQGQLTATPSRIELANLKANIPGGALLAQGQIIDGQIELDATIPGLDLLAYSEALRGQLAGTLTIKAPLADFSTERAIATGQVTLTEGISLIEDPINAQVRWNGQGIDILRATAPEFWAQGSLGVDLEGPTAPQLTTVNLDIDKRNYDLASLPFELPANSQLFGRADLTGKLFGEAYAPQLAGDLEIYDLLVNDLPFEPQLTGKLDFATEGDLSLQAQGQENKVQLTLNQFQEPKAFFVQNNGAIAIGQTTAPQKLAVEIKDVPLTALNWDVVNDYGYGNVSGTATGNFQVSLPTYDLFGPLAIAKPGVGPFLGDRFQGDLAIRNGILSIRNGELTQKTNQFLVDAQIIPDEINPKFSGNLTLASAEVADAIIALETLNFIQPEFGTSPSFGNAADLITNPVGNAQAPLIFQLQRLAEINQLQNQQLAQENPITQLPTLQDLSGIVKGRVSFKGSANIGIQANFSLESDTINWESYPLTNILAQGSYNNNELAISTFTIDGFGGNLAFQGNIGEQNNGALAIRDLPIGDLSQLLAPNLFLEGSLNAQASFEGSFDNPTIAGRLQLSDGLLNESEIKTAEADFKFEQARLNLSAAVDLNNPDPILVAGSIPYSFPFMTAQPESDELDLRLRIKNEGLGLLNLFTDQLNWESGVGEIDVAVLGTMKQPLVQGKILVDQATLSASALPEPLTDVSGEILFDQALVKVNRLQGNFSDGALGASGTLPLFPIPFQNSLNSGAAEGLEVSLKEIALNLKGLYRGGVDGRLRIIGSLLEPIVSGQVGLSEGQIVLSSATSLSDSVNPSANPGTGESSNNLTLSQSGAASDSDNQPLRFENLVVQLGKNVKILQPPLLNFTAEGELAVNGTIDSPSPDGIVKFTKGEVNLFTSIFQLNRRKQNFASFSPRNGIDPYLQVNLITTLTEVNNSRNDRLSEFEDPIAGSLGTLESVRINASVDGQASQLLNNFQEAVELSSNPLRSEGEILALLSGGLPEAIQDGNADLALVNIASSAVLNRVQTFVDDAFGGRAVFRLFPILIPSDTEDRSVLAFGSEFGYDVTDDLSVSVLQVLSGTDDPTRFNISYDINERFRARGSVSIDGEGTGLLEYRFRF